jgi:transcriptional regulator with XRE-family HTH domain
MPTKILPSAVTPSLVQERLAMWGKCIRTQRIRQRILARDLCARIGVSDATLRRLENGDAGASASLYLSALLVLGILDQAAPVLELPLWTDEGRKRVRPPRPESDAHDF